MFQKFQLYSSVEQLSTSLCPKIHLIRSRSKSVPWSKPNVTNIPIGRRADTLYTVDDFIDGNRYTKKVN